MVSDSLREDVGREHDSCVHRTLFEPSSCGSRNGETCSMQVAVCIESICTIQTLSAHTVHSWVGLCIPHLHCAFRTTLFLASPTYIGRVFAFCTCILHCPGTLSALSMAVGEFLHSAFLHPASCTSLTATLLILHLHLHPLWGTRRSAFCILHLHPASGAVHSFGADSAFCILPHPASFAGSLRHVAPSHTLFPRCP